MTIIDIINNVIAGGLLGTLGQGVRIAVGLKKLSDSNTAKVAQGITPEQFKPSRLIISIFIGFVAGALGMIVKGATPATNGDYSTEAIVTIIAIGYSGADFIEGVFNTYLPKFTPPPGTTEADGATAASPGSLPNNTPNFTQFSSQHMPLYDSSKINTVPPSDPPPHIKL